MIRQALSGTFGSRSVGVASVVSSVCQEVKTEGPQNSDVGVESGVEMTQGVQRKANRQ